MGRVEQQGAIATMERGQIMQVYLAHWEDDSFRDNEDEKIAINSSLRAAAIIADSFLRKMEQGKAGVFVFELDGRDSDYLPVSSIRGEEYSIAENFKGILDGESKCSD